MSDLDRQNFIIINNNKNNNKNNNNKYNKNNNINNIIFYRNLTLTNRAEERWLIDIRKDLHR